MLAWIMAATVAAHLPGIIEVPSLIDDIGQKIRTYEGLLVITSSNVGRVISCSTVVSGGSAALDKKICESFIGTPTRPARTRDGAAVFGKSYLRVWAQHIERPYPHVDVDLTLEKMPTGAPIHPSASLVLTVDPQGQVIACDIFKSSGFPALDEAGCKFGPSASQIAALKDATGAPVVSVQPLIVGFGVYTKVVMGTKATGAQFSDPGSYMPERARRLGLSGYANLACTATAEGALTACSVDEEGPTGFYFGAAALALAKDRWAMVAPGAPGPVLVRVDLR